jgi:hypothetical protein
MYNKIVILILAIVFGALFINFIRPYISGLSERTEFIIISLLVATISVLIATILTGLPF